MQTYVCIKVIIYTAVSSLLCNGLINVMNNRLLFHNMWPSLGNKSKHAIVR